MTNVHSAKKSYDALSHGEASVKTTNLVYPLRAVFGITSGGNYLLLIQGPRKAFKIAQSIND